MKYSAMLLATLATLYGYTPDAIAQQQETDQRAEVKEVGSQWWQGNGYAKPSTQEPTPVKDIPNSAPSWQSGYGWEMGRANNSQDVQNMHPTLVKMPFISVPWRMQAQQALDYQLDAMANGGEVIEGRGNQPDESSRDRWMVSLLSAEQRLSNRLSKAQAEGIPFLVWVNIPAYKLRVLDTTDGTVLMESRVVVGKPGTSTPRFDTKITNLKFNPDWSPPKSIKGSKWTRPGPRNPLGRVRFSTDNGIGIYLHDSNQKDLFEHANRAYSHGCIRVEEWKNLAMLLSGEDSSWIDGQTTDWNTKWVDIMDVPVFLDYQRIDFNDDGVLVELPDIYRLER